MVDHGDPGQTGHRLAPPSAYKLTLGGKIPTPSKGTVEATAEPAARPAISDPSHLDNRALKIDLDLPLQALNLIGLHRAWFSRPCNTGEKRTIITAFSPLLQFLRKQHESALGKEQGWNPSR